MGTRYPVTGAKEGCKLSCGCWELNTGRPLPEHQVLLTTDPFLWPLQCLLSWKLCPVLSRFCEESKAWC